MFFSKNEVVTQNEVVMPSARCRAWKRRLVVVGG